MNPTTISFPWRIVSIFYNEEFYILKVFKEETDLRNEIIKNSMFLHKLFKTKFQRKEKIL